MNRYKFDELKIGHKEEFSVLITEDMMKSFCEICGDTNPLHIDEKYAKSAGYPSRVVYGMLVSSFYSTLAGVHLPGEHCLLQEILIKFSNPVYPGDTLKISGEIIERTDAYKRIEIKAKIFNQHGKTVSSAKIKAGVRDE